MKGWVTLKIVFYFSGSCIFIVETFKCKTITIQVDLDWIILKKQWCLSKTNKTIYVFSVGHISETTNMSISKSIWERSPIKLDFSTKI